MVRRMRRSGAGGGFRFVLLLLPCVAPVAAQDAASPAPAAPVRPVSATLNSPRAELVETVKQDPLRLIQLAHEKYDRDIRDYGCTLVKQEFVQGRLSPVQVVNVRYRRSPQSVYLFFKENADRAKRALYVDSPEFVDKSGQRVARIEPNGIARLLVSEVTRPIHGEEARAASRRYMDEFGFEATLEAFDEFNSLASRNGHLKIQYVSEGTIEGRPTFVIVRHLPYDGPNGVYPDAKLLVHFDQEWLLPVAMYSYADHDGRQLLGSYVFTNIYLNPGFTDEDFRF